jgi:bacterioferritin-associated ferredoxin
VPSACLSVETLAAAIAGGVTAQELESVCAHLGECGRCRAVVALVMEVDEEEKEELP